MSEQLRSNDLVAFERIIHTNWRKTQHFEIYRGATTHSLAIGSPDRPQFSQALTYMSEWFPVNNSVLFVCWKQQTWCIRISFGVACCLSVCVQTTWRIYRGLRSALQTALSSPVVLRVSGAATVFWGYQQLCAGCRNSAIVLWGPRTYCAGPSCWSTTL